MRNFISRMIRRGDGEGDGGFTLIELLVVIAIIGILAVAVLSAINPLEQINKGRDTQKNTDASQLLGAIERYYANSNPPAYPWNEDATGYTRTTDDPTEAYVFDSGASGADWDWVNNLSSTQEIKDAFSSRLKSSEDFVILRTAGSGASTYVCYYPVSNTGRKTADNYCESNATSMTAFGGNNPCATNDGTPPSVVGTNPICVP